MKLRAELDITVSALSAPRGSALITYIVTAEWRHDLLAR